MLNISKNSINKHVPLQDFKSFLQLKKTSINKLSVIILLLVVLASLAIVFLPWTQNIQVKGYITTQLPEQRPQAIQSVIAGRMEEWYVQEGDFVQKGDTIVFVSEVKSEYFDPNLMERTQEQLVAKDQSIVAYDSKIAAIDQQVQAIIASMRLKLEQNKNKLAQTENKITIDENDLIALKTKQEIEKNQFDRTNELFKNGLKSMSELQEKELKLQETNAKVIAQENKLLNQKQELNNLKIEISAIEQEYADKTSKAQSEKQSALSDRQEAIGNYAKLQSQMSNYTEREKMYHITAPQDGFITKTIQKGIGEILKEGEDIATIMPAKYDLATEVYIRPQDLPLVNINDGVSLRFDGWPAIVISGWPESSTGVFKGKISAIDQFISPNGYYRLMVVPNLDERPWPENLRVGTGAIAFILLNNVPIWYELWRKLNGFPPNFYTNEQEQKESKEEKQKIPLKKIK